MYELVQYNDAHRSSGSSHSALRSMNRPVFHRLAYPLALVILMLASGMACAQVPAPAAPKIAATPVLEDRYPVRRTAFADGVESYADLIYSTPLGYRPLRLDLYRPTRSSDRGPLPLVLYIHGGGWQSGHTRHAGAFEDWPAVLASLSARGYVVVSIEYRLNREAAFPAAVHDVKNAIRWLREHSREYGIDATRAVVWGGSAGGQLAALAATTCNVASLAPPPVTGSAANTSSTTSDCVQGLVAWYGVFDFAPLLNVPAAPGAAGQQGPSPQERYLGCAASQCATAAAAASAITYLDRADPPALLIHGALDKVVPVQQSKSFEAALKGKGVSVELLIIPGVDHSFIGSTHASTQAASLSALDRTFEFIDKTIGSARK